MPGDTTAAERSLTSIPSQMGAPHQGNRDIRFDFFRGLALFLIFFDHVRGVGASALALREFNYFDASEIFIFTAGYVACLAYGRVLQKQGPLATALRIYRRVGQIYCANIALFLIYGIIIIFLQQNMNYKDFFMLFPDIIFLKSPFSMMNVLPVYIVLLVFFPIVLFLLEKNPRSPVIISAMLYCLTVGFQWKLSIFVSNWANVLAWQFLFVIGATIGYRRVSGRGPISAPVWLLILASAIAGGFVILQVPAVSVQIFGPDLPWRLVSDKQNLAPFRLIDFLAVAGVVAHFVGRDSFLYRWSVLRPVSLCGRHSLLVFCVGAILVLIWRPIWMDPGTGFGAKLVILVAGVTAMTIAAWLHTRFSSGFRTAITIIRDLGRRAATASISDNS